MKKLLLLMFSVTLILMFSVSAIAQKGKIVKVANNHELIVAKNNPNIQTVELDEGFYQLYNTYFTQGTIVKFANNASKGGICDYWIQPNDYCFDKTATAGTARAGTSSPDPGDPCTTLMLGKWTSVDPAGGTLTWDSADPVNYIEGFTVDKAGTYELTYTWDYPGSGAPPNTKVTTSMNFYSLATVSLDAPDGCVTSLVQYSIGYGDYPYPGQETVWKLDGATTVIPEASVWHYAPPCGDHTLTVTISQPTTIPGPCTTVTESDGFRIDDKPVVYAGPDDIVCGLSYTLNPTSSAVCWDPGGPVTTITMTGGPGTIVDQHDNYVEVDICGEYTFCVNVENGLCIAGDKVNITFTEEPNPTILGDIEVPICPSNYFTYTAFDGRTGLCPLSPLTWAWEIISGPGTIIGDDDTESIVVDWEHGGTGNVGDPSELYVNVCIAAPTKNGTDLCCGEDTIDIIKVSPVFAGQVKYWNEFETYMPTPFPTDINGTYPPDYYYVTLYIGSVAMTEIETVLVEPGFITDTTALLSYFEFTIPSEYLETCEAEFILRIWDGGLLYDPGFPPNGFNRYLGANYTYNNWGGVNATDALALQKMATGININGAPYNYTWVGPFAGITPPYGYYSKGIADVNNSNTITALDALIANFRAVGYIAKYPSAIANTMFSPNFEVTGRMVDTLPKTTWSAYFNDAAGYVWDDIPFAHSDHDYQYYDSAVHHKYTSDPILWEGGDSYMNIYYECLGDINASYVPTSGGFKAEPTMELIYEGSLATSVGEELTIPVRIDSDAQLGALTLNLNYSNDLIEVIGTNYEKDFFNINHEEGYVRIGWFSVDPINVSANEVIANVMVRILADIEPDTRLFELDAMTELADPSANRIDGVNFKISGVTTNDTWIGSELTANNYPNPFKDKTIISYILPEAGKVQVVVYSKMGQIVSTIVDQSQDAGTQTVEFNHSDLNAGVYFYKITLNGHTKFYTVTKSMVVVR